MKIQCVLLTALLAVGASFSGCSCGSDSKGDPRDDGGTLSDGGQDPDSGDPNHNRVPTDIQNPDNPNIDSDCDGLTDAEEFSSVYAGGKKTDPGLWDTDGDGISDGVEVGRTSSVDPHCTDLTVDQDPQSITNPTATDSDGDGCADGEEDTNHNGKVDVGESNPALPGDCHSAVSTVDSDQDGLPDSVEDTNGNGVVDPGETDPHNPDTDGDGLLDGVEDADHNGRFNAGETDPRVKDTDCDGLIDGPTKNGVKGEDQNANGVVDPGETNPRLRDTDGDGLPDGLEVGVSVAPEPGRCPLFTPDTDPNTTTNPLNPDTDHDGISDGAEDANKDGKHDSTELDPNNPSDGAGPASKVCPAPQLKTVTFKASEEPDLQLALPTGFTEFVDVKEGTSTKGMIGYDPTNKVAFIVWKQAHASSSTTPALDDETAIRPSIAGVASLPVANRVGFTSWDGFSAALGNYEQSGAVDLKARVTALAKALVTSSATGLSGTAGVNGPFTLQVQYVHRSDNSVIGLLAITPKSLYTGQAMFNVQDTSGGSALAQFNDRTTVQCETFTTGNGKVDFLFIVDDSPSMDSAQAGLAAAGDSIATQLNSSTLDWRVAMVTTSYLSSTKANRNVLRGFTTNINEFKAWVTQGSSGSSTNPSTCTCSGFSGANTAHCSGVGSNNGCYVDTNGDGAETALGSARKAINQMTPPVDGQTNKVRPDAELVVVLLGDADDQTSDYNTAGQDCGFKSGSTCESVDDFQSFFKGSCDPGAATDPTTCNKLRVPIVVHAIACPDTGNTNGLPSTASSSNAPACASLSNTGDHLSTKECTRTQAGYWYPSACGEYNPPVRRSAAVVDQTGGVFGSLYDSSNIDTGTADPTNINATTDAIVRRVISSAGYRPAKPPIGASIKVAVSATSGTCNADDLPRSRTDGFDFDGLGQAISFFGQCRPTAGATAAVSYRAWQQDSSSGADCSADCNGTCNSYEACNPSTCQCQCTQTLSCAPGFTFQSTDGQCGCFCDTTLLNCGAAYQVDANSCSCACKADCGGCPSGKICNLSRCACVTQIN